MDENEEEKALDEVFGTCALGRSEECKSWILKGIPVDSRNRFGQTALMVAVANGQVEVVQVLLNHHADPSLGDDWGYNALMKAAAFGHLEIFNLLRNHCHSVMCDTFLGNVTAVTEAASNGHNNIIELCLAQDSQLIDIPVELTKMTPLMLAVAGGHQATVEMLLKNKAQLDLENSSSQTAMDMALQLMDDSILGVLKVYSRRIQRDNLDVTTESNKTHKTGMPLTPTSRFPRRKEEIEIFTAIATRRSRSKERLKSKKSLTSKSDEIFRFILQSEGLEKLWDIFTKNEIDLKTFFALNRDDFMTIGITDEQIIMDLMNVSHHYKPLFSI